MDRIKKVIRESVEVLIKNTEKKALSLEGKHNKKLHFIPIKYRIFGGMLQSLNIQFGNYIEELIHTIAEQEEHLEVITKYSSKKFPLSMTSKSDSLIDSYITECQMTSDTDVKKRCADLLDKILKIETTEKEKQINAKHDVDVLFYDKRNGKYYYLEVKYNDDHDTGKFVNINSKLLKTYAGLLNIPEIEDKTKITPILFYFTNKRMKGNIYLDEEEHILRGKSAFKKFFTLEYEELENYMSEIGEDEEIIGMFDKLYKRIRYEG